MKDGQDRIDKIACTFYRRAYKCLRLWDLNEKKVKELLYVLVFVWRPKSEEWPRKDMHEETDKKNRQKLHACVLDCLLNDWRRSSRMLCFVFVFSLK